MLNGVVKYFYETRRHSNGQTVKLPTADHVELPTAENVPKLVSFYFNIISFYFNITNNLY